MSTLDRQQAPDMSVVPSSGGVCVDISLHLCHVTGFHHQYTINASAFENMNSYHLCLLCRFL